MNQLKDVNEIINSNRSHLHFLKYQKEYSCTHGVKLEFSEKAEFSYLL